MILEIDCPMSNNAYWCMFVVVDITNMYLSCYSYLEIKKRNPRICPQ